MSNKQKFYKIELLDNFIPYYLSTLFYTMSHEGFSIVFRISHKYDNTFKKSESEEDLVLCLPLCRISNITTVNLTKEEYKSLSKHPC